MAKTDVDLSQYDLKAVLQKIDRLRPISLEEMFTRDDCFNVPASPLQRAICRAVDGKPLGKLGERKEVAESFGGQVNGSSKPLEVDILSCIRGGKSLFAACAGVHWSQTCDVSSLRPGDIARVSCVSLTKRNAAAVFSHLVHSIRNSPRLSKLMVGEPGVDTVVLRHPTGREVEVCVVAGDRAGGSLVSTWSAGVIFDEYTRMVGEEEGVINYDEMHAAVIGRLLPGAQILSLGSPYGSTGPAYRRYNEFFGRFGRVLVIKAPGWVMNPTIWTPERCEDFKKNNPDQYLTDCAAEFSSLEDAMFPLADVQKCTRVGPLDVPYLHGADYVAVMDPGTRGNAWTLVIATRVGDKRVVAIARQWVGTKSEPLDPDLVIGEVAKLCQGYGVRTVWSDQVMFDALRSMARNYGLDMVEKRFTSTTRLAAYTNLKLRMAAGEVELPPDQHVREDLLRVRKRIVPGGATVELPETSDKRHCDYAPVVVLAMSKWMNDVAKAPGPRDFLRLPPDEQKMWDDAAKRWARR